MKKIMKIRAVINEIVSRKTIEIIKKSKSLSFEKINKIDKLISRLIKLRSF